jgi:hypothetical protein
MIKLESYRLPWPAPQSLWADPPWILSGTSLTAWFESDSRVVESLVSSNFKSELGETGVVTRLRFYDINFEPRDGDPGYKKEMSGSFKEAVIAFKGEISGIKGEFSAFMWTDDDQYIGWGREIFGWPLIRNRFELGGTFWGDLSDSQTISRVVGKDFDLSLTIPNEPGTKLDLPASANWLTPRRILFPSGEEPERRDLNIVRPTIIQKGDLFQHSGTVKFHCETTSTVYGLAPLTGCVVHRHANFRICVGDNVQTIKGGV